MSAHCCNLETPESSEITNLPRYRRILWIALVVNAAMFLVELASSFGSGSLSLLADAIDFGGDALNYAVSLAVLASALAWRARAAMLKAVSMMGFGLYVLVSALWAVWDGTVPDAASSLFWRWCPMWPWPGCSTPSAKATPICAVSGCVHATTPLATLP